jgi:predicted enzyme related to lactoylglutathione lyase
MSEKTAYAPGTPCWVDLSTSDLDAGIDFYQALFDWEAERVEAPEAGQYTMLTLRGKAVAGAGPLFHEGQPTTWSTYLSVADADEAVVLATKAGGTVLTEPMDIFDSGRMAFVRDTAGAVVGVWEPYADIGSQLVDEPGTRCWSELATRDVDAAKEFYGTVFGWVGAAVEVEGTSYTEWRMDDATVGGMIKITEEWPQEVPPHWMVYFAVTDPDAAAAKAEELGGKTLVPPTDVPPGRFAVLNDPQGGVFSVIALREQPAS